METQEFTEKKAPEARVTTICDRKTIVKNKKKTCGSETQAACGRCANHCRGYADVEGRRTSCPDHL